MFFALSPCSLAAISVLQDAMASHKGAPAAASASVAGLALCSAGEGLSREMLWDLEQALHSLLLDMLALLWVQSGQGKVQADAHSDPESSRVDGDPTLVRPPASVPLIEKVCAICILFSANSIPTKRSRYSFHACVSWAVTTVVASTKNFAR